MNDIVNLPPRREIQSVVDAVPILDTARFEHMQRIANIMARSSMIPETLRTEGKANDKKDLPFEQVLSNCFLVVNQAARWGIDPFAAISCCAVVHGRLAYEGKLVAAVLDAKLGIKLHHHFVGDATSEGYRIYLSDQPFGDAVIQQLRPGIKIPGLRLWDGSVAEWKTMGAGTPWTPKNFPRMLVYRGARDWTRIYEPAVLLGVYTDDELLDLAEDARARRATPVASIPLADRLASAKTQGTGGTAGFSIDHVEAETALEPNSNSPSLPTEADEPATAAPDSNAVAGDLSESAPVPPVPGVDEGGEDGISGALPSSSDLPQGWQIAYSAALRRAQKKESLPKYASEFWKQYGGWNEISRTDARDTAVAIYDAFADNFGDKAAIDDLLREIV